MVIVYALYFITENPYQDALGGAKMLPPATYIGVLDYEAENMGLADKYEAEACRRYLWKFNMTLKPVSNCTYIVCTLYEHCTKASYRNGICFILYSYCGSWVLMYIGVQGMGMGIVWFS